MAGNAAFENGSRLPEPCPPKAGSWCSCYERRPHVRLTVLGNGPRRANGLGPWIPKQLETFRCPRDNPLTKPSSCEVCSAFTRIAASTLARSPYVVTAIRRLQTLRLLHVCSGRFRLERSPGGACTHWKSAALSRRTWKAPTLSLNGEGSIPGHDPVSVREASGVRTAGMQPKDFMGTREIHQVQAKACRTGQAGKARKVRGPGGGQTG